MKWIKLIDDFHYRLMNAQKERKNKNKWMGEELEWVIFERETMFNFTNEERLKNNLPPVEGWAAGHSDYTFKFALYCAELSIGKSKHPDAM